MPEALSEPTPFAFFNPRVVQPLNPSCKQSPRSTGVGLTLIRLVPDQALINVTAALPFG